MTVRTEGLLELINRFRGAPEIAAKVTAARLDALGRRVKYLMGIQLKSRRYTGALADSIDYAVNMAQKSVAIGPTAKRGRWDAGMLLEMGTRPIPNLPFGAIARWAEFRGIPAGAVWWKIKTKGVTAHPFLRETLNRGDVETAIRNTAGAIAHELTAGVMRG